MKRAVKWTLIGVGGLIVLVIIVLLAAPMFIELDRHKPMIEETVTEATGRPFRLAGELDLSLFPWAGISLSRIHLGNPEGFEKEDMLYVESFEVRLKLLPLIFRDLEVEKFILQGARLVLEQRDDGVGNWEGLGGEPPEEEEAKKAEEAKEAEPEKAKAFPLESLLVGDFSVSGSALWIDHKTDRRKELSDLALKLKDISLDQPVGISLSARLDEQPLGVEGSLGPLGADPMAGPVPLDLLVEAFGELELGITGRLEDLASAPAFELALQLPAFSPRKLVTALGEPFPVETTDPEALKHLALQAKAKGGPAALSVSDGVLELDQTRMTFSARVRDFGRPDLNFSLHGDQINLDRYLPPESKAAEAEKKKGKEPAGKTEGAGGKEPPDYGPLRRLVLDGEIRLDELKAQGLTLTDLMVKLTSNEGILKADPLEASLYQGTTSAVARVDVSRDTPKISLQTEMKDVQAGPLVKDLMEKDVIEGNLKASTSITASGDEVEAVKRTLNGKGDLLFKDGAIVGIDLPGMARNAKAAFGLSEKTEERPTTDFSELHAPFTIKDGVVDTRNTTMASPLLRLKAAGKADLVEESLDFRVEPTFVATLKGQDDTAERSGIRVPILVSGTFSSPKFRPDLEGMVKEKIKSGVPDTEGLKEMLSPGEKTGEEEQDIEEKAKGLLKGLMGD